MLYVYRDKLYICGVEYKLNKNIMRFKLTLELGRNRGNAMPIDYQYFQSAVIYRILQNADSDYSEWLHENGFQLQSGKQFKLFSYSPFKVEKRKVIGDRLFVLGGNLEWQISFLPEKSTNEFVQGVFLNPEPIQICDKVSGVELNVRSVELMPDPEFGDEMEYSLMSPLYIKNEKNAHLSPYEQGANEILVSQIRDKYNSFYGEEYDGEIKIEFTGDPRQKLVTIKRGTPMQSSIKCFAGLKFRLSAAPIIQNLVYNTGLGNLTSMGFGCVNLI